MKKVLLAVSAILTGLSPVFSQNSLITFNARNLVVLSDADLSASTFTDGLLYREATAKDQLTSVKFPVDLGNTVQSILVPNSAVNYSKSIAVPPTGGLAFVIESKTSPADGVKEIKDLAAEHKGQRVYVVDIVNPVSPKLKFPFSIGTNPLSIDIYKNELIISTEEMGKKLDTLTESVDKMSELLAQAKGARWMVGFLLMIGMTLIADGFGFHVPKGYIYAAMAFSGFVEILNILARRRRQRLSAETAPMEHP